MGLFGWSLPPGCSQRDIDRAFGADDIPECEDCDLIEEDGNCPALINNRINTDICPKLAKSACDWCKKPYDTPKLLGEFKKEHVISHIADVIFCCGDECSIKAKEDLDKIAKELCDGE